MYPQDEEALLNGPSLASAKETTDQTPLPKRQLSLVYFIAAVEMITTQMVDPFFIRFVQDTGITGGDERKAGYYSGIIASVYCMTEALSVFNWGWASDRHGRRPILLIGALGVSLTMLWFGLSSSYESLLISRAMQGSFNGAIGASKTMIAELSDSTNIANAFAILAVCWTLGTTSGEYIGGLFAEPATRWPDIFGQSAYFRQHPYALPCILTTLIGLLSTILAYLWLKETHPTIPSDESTPLLQDDAPRSSRQLSGAYDDVEQVKSPSEAPLLHQPPPLRDLLVPRVLRPLAVYVLQSLTNSSHLALMPLVYATSVENGGLGMTPYQIGMVMSFFGVFNMTFQVLCTARLVRYYGPRNAHVFAHSCYLFGMTLYPLLNYFARQTGGLNPVVWLVLVVQLSCRIGNTLGFASISIFIVHSAPSRNALGATTGLAQAVTSAARGIAPSIACSLFAMSQERNLLGGNFVYVVLCLIAFVGLRSALTLPKELEFTY